jgi:immunoglobulin-binding protein 1
VQHSLACISHLKTQSTQRKGWHRRACVSAPLQDLPLPALWQRARAVLKQLEVVPASDPRAQQLVQQGTACLRAAACAVDALALFSANEDKDDLATGDVKYLMIPFYQAEVLGHTHAGVGR